VASGQPPLARTILAFALGIVFLASGSSKLIDLSSIAGKNIHAARRTPSRIAASDHAARAAATGSGGRSIASCPSTMTPARYTA